VGKRITTTLHHHRDSARGVQSRFILAEDGIMIWGILLGLLNMAMFVLCLPILGFSSGWFTLMVGITLGIDVCAYYMGVKNRA
jgi:hypothetical protein